MTYVYHTSILHFEENDNEQDLDLSFSSASGVSHIQSVYPNYQKGTTKREKELREWDAVERRRLQGRWYNKGLSGFSKDCVLCHTLAFKHPKASISSKMKEGFYAFFHLSCKSVPKTYTISPSLFSCSSE